MDTVEAWRKAEKAKPKDAPRPKAATVLPASALDADAKSRRDKLTREMFRREKVLEEAENAVKAAQAHLDEVQCKELPNLIENQGLFSGYDYVHTDGKTYKIRLEDAWRSKQSDIAEADKPLVYDWFVEQGQGGIIKSHVLANVGLHEDDMAGRIIAALKEQFPEIETKQERKIEAATFTKAINVILEGGHSLHAAITATPVRQATYKKPKKPAADF